MSTKKLKNKSQKKVPSRNFELKKPSELCQVLFYSDVEKQEFAQLSTMQIDLASTLFYLISDIMNKQDLCEAEIRDWSSINHFEINLQTIAEMMNKYDNGYYEPIISNLQELSKIQVLTNTLYKNKEQEQTHFHLIRKISWLKNRKTTHKRVKVWIEPELLLMFHNVNKMYTSYYLQIQYGLNSKYSKLLYEVLKDYARLGEITLDFTVLKALMNIDIVNKPDLDKWSIFNRDVLKRAVKEVSTKSDILVEYEPIKEREVKKLEVTKVKFTIKEQKSKLIDYSQQDDGFDIDSYVVSDEIDKTAISPEELKYLELAQRRMDKIKLTKVINNEKAYLKGIIKQLKEDDTDVSGMIHVDEIIGEIKEAVMDNKNDKNQLIILDGYHKGDPLIAISNDYLIYSVVKNVNLTKTIEETINKINIFKSDGKQFKLIETPGYLQDLEISYL